VKVIYLGLHSVCFIHLHGDFVYNGLCGYFYIIGACPPPSQNRSSAHVSNIKSNEEIINEIGLLQLHFSFTLWKHN